MTTAKELAFGLMHPKTGKLARELRAYDDQRVVRIYHNEESGSHGDARDVDDEEYDDIDESAEEDDRAVFDYPDLYTVLGIIRGIGFLEDAEYEEFRWFQEGDREGMHWPELESDFSEFVPVAFIREKKRVLGIGETYIASQKIMLVKPKDPEGNDYDLVEI